MPSIKNLEMADAISLHNRVIIKKSLLSAKAYYEPTQSRIKVKILSYPVTEGEHLERILDMPLAKWADEINRKGKPQPGAIGNFRLELCLSEDHQFCALQLFRFADYGFRSLGEAHFFEGNESEQVIENLF